MNARQPSSQCDKKKKRTEMQTNHKNKNVPHLTSNNHFQWVLSQKCEHTIHTISGDISWLHIKNLSNKCTVQRDKRTNWQTTNQTNCQVALQWKQVHCWFSRLAVNRYNFRDKSAVPTMTAMMFQMRKTNERQMQMRAREKERERERVQKIEIEIEL